MAGEPIAELNAGLKAFRDELVADELASKRVEVACITFGPVNVATEFETASVFQPPWLQALGDTPMGAAITTGVELVAPAQGDLPRERHRLLPPLDLPDHRRRPDRRVGRRPRSR